MDCLFGKRLFVWKKIVCKRIDLFGKRLLNLEKGLFVWKKICFIWKNIALFGKLALFGKRIVCLEKGCLEKDCLFGKRLFVWKKIVCLEKDCLFGKRLFVWKKIVWKKIALFAGVGPKLSKYFGYSDTFHHTEVQK